MDFGTTRDLRSAAQAPKRAKTHSKKWSRGSRPAAGCARIPEMWTPSDNRAVKLRPHSERNNHHSMTPNVVKAKMSWDVPPYHSRSKISAMEELHDSTITRSLIDMYPPYNHFRKPSLADNIMYNFDRAEGPLKPQSLGIFVKSNGKATEKLVADEYEVLDANGDALKGRKARRNLRRPVHITSDDLDVTDDDGFELI